MTEGAAGFEAGRGAAFLGADFLAAAFLGAAFRGAAFLATFLAAFFRADFPFAFALALTGRFAFLATLLRATDFFALAFGRFLDLLFFAMITRLLEVSFELCPESSLEKVRCHQPAALYAAVRIQ